MRIFRLLMIVVIVGCALPLIAGFAADAIARYHGCELNLTTLQPCFIGGRDWGEDLRTLAYMTYFLFVTLPVLIGAVAIWIAVELVRWVARRRSNSA